MECAITTDPFRMRTSLQAVPGDYDGYPTLDRISLSAMPLVISPDRAAVASVLCFANFIGGALGMSKGCSPQVSNAIRRWFAPADMHVLNIDFEPAARVEGDALLHVVAEGINDDVDKSQLVMGNDVVFHVVNEGTGSVATAHELKLASNAWLFADADGALVERILPAVGIAVLFADDFFVRSISIPAAGQQVDRPIWPKLESLLDSTGLGLVAA